MKKPGDMWVEGERFCFMTMNGTVVKLKGELVPPSERVLDKHYPAQRLPDKNGGG